MSYALRLVRGFHSKAISINSLEYSLGFVCFSKLWILDNSQLSFTKTGSRTWSIIAKCCIEWVLFEVQNNININLNNVSVQGKWYSFKGIFWELDFLFLCCSMGRQLLRNAHHHWLKGSCVGSPSFKWVTQWKLKEGDSCPRGGRREKRVVYKFFAILFTFSQRPHSLTWRQFAKGYEI